jgi:hypothetical protein
MDYGLIGELNAIGNLKIDCEEEQNREDEFLMGLGAMNTVSDFVSELYDVLFREILGDDVMDRTLGSFDKKELFLVMSRIFLQDGNQKLYKQMLDRQIE